MYLIVVLDHALGYLSGWNFLWNYLDFLEGRIFPDKRTPSSSESQQKILLKMENLADADKSLPKSNILVFFTISNSFLIVRVNISNLQICNM